MRWRFTFSPAFRAVDGSTLVAAASDAPAAPEARPTGSRAWRMRRVEWNSAVGLMEPFTRDPKEAIHQFLGEAGDAQVIISTSNHW
jgi:hypothetical protein